MSVGSVRPEEWVPPMCGPMRYVENRFPGATLTLGRRPRQVTQPDHEVLWKTAFQTWAGASGNRGFGYSSGSSLRPALLGDSSARGHAGRSRSAARQNPEAKKSRKKQCVSWGLRDCRDQPNVPLHTRQCEGARAKKRRPGHIGPIALPEVGCPKSMGAKFPSKRRNKHRSLAIRALSQVQALELSQRWKPPTRQSFEGRAARERLCLAESGEA